MSEVSEEAAAPPTAAQRIRAQAREATRQALLEAGLAETVERGGELPGLDSVVARAGYTRGAFYFYFKDRKEYLLALLDWVLTDILAQLLRGVTEGATDLKDVITRFNEAMAGGAWPDVGNDIRAGYLAVLRELTNNPELRDQHARVMTAVIDDLTTLMERSQESGALRSDVDARRTATVVFLSGIGSIMWDDIGIPLDHVALGEALIAVLEPPH